MGLGLVFGTTALGNGGIFCSVIAMPSRDLSFETTATPFGLTAKPVISGWPGSTAI
jgi:hypothetical protein